MVFSPDGRHLATVESQHKDDTTIRIWDWVKGKQICARKVANSAAGPPNYSPRLLAYTPDGKAIATADFSGKSVVVKLWDPATLKDIRTIGEDSKMRYINHIAFSADGKAIAISSIGHPTLLLDSATGNAISKVEQATSALFGKDGARVYTNTLAGIKEWDVATGKLVRECAAPRANWSGITRSPDGSTLVLSMGNRNNPEFLDLAQKEITSLNQPGLPLHSVRFTADGKHVLTQSDYMAKTWETDTGKELGKFYIPAFGSAPPSGIVSPNGKIIAGPGGNGVVLLEAASGREIRQIENTPPRVSLLIHPMRFSPDSKTLAIWDETNRRAELYDVATGGLLRRLDAAPEGHDMQGNSYMVLSANGKRLACWAFVSPGGQQPSPVLLFDTASGKQIGALPPPAGFLLQDSAAFSPDGRCLAMARKDGTVAVYELASGRTRSSFGTKPAPWFGVRHLGGMPFANVEGEKNHTHPSCLAFSPDGMSLAQGGLDSMVHVWDVRTGRELATFNGHSAGVGSVAFSPDGKRIASASEDTAALIWDVSKFSRPDLPVKKLQVGDLEQCWQMLAEADAAKAFAAISDLVAAPKVAVLFLKERLKPATPLDRKKVESLIAQLDEGQFKIREQAASDLFKLGEQVVPALEKTLAANPPLELQRRLQNLRGKLTDMILEGDRLRAHRAIEVLETIGTPEARRVLQALAAGAPGARVTESARTVLDRWASVVDEKSGR